MKKATLIAGCSLLLAVTVSCGDPETIEVSVPGPTVTATVTTTTTATATATVTAAATPGPPSAPEPSAADEADDGATGEDHFDKRLAVSAANHLIDDIRSVDERLRDGVAVSSALLLLSASYERLSQAGAPPRVNDDYLPRLATLREFVIEAAGIYASDPVNGAAKYSVVRKQTGRLFGQLNAAIGTNFRLP